jgi:hypothetical protein
MTNAGMGQQNVVSPSALDKLTQVDRAVSQLTDELIELVNDTKVDEGYRQRAICALGELRQKKAIIPLFDHLLFKAGSISEPGHLTYFPAANALAAYGNDLYPTLLTVVSDERSPEYVYVLACLLHTIDGKRIALLRVENMAAAERLSAIQRQNLTRLINRLKTTNFDDPLNWPRLNLKQQAKDDVRSEPAD